LLIQYGGSLKAYNERNEEKLPQIMYIINNFSAIMETYQNFDEILIPVARECERYGINVILTSSSANVPSRISQYFQTRFALHMQQAEEYDTMFDARVKTRPKDNEGRGYCSGGDVVHEFQTASLVEDRGTIVEFLDKIATLLKQNNSAVAPRIPMLPEKVTLDFVEGEISSVNALPIGVYRESLKTVKYDFFYNKSTVISSNKVENMNSFVDSLMDVFLRIPGVALFFVDPTGKMSDIGTKTYNNRKVDYFDKPESYNEAFAKFSIIAKKPEFKKFKVVYIFYSMDKIKAVVDQDKMDTLFSAIKASENCTSIIIDSTGNVKGFDYDGWYQLVKNNTDGIWIGKGFDEQQSFRVSKITKDMTKSRPLNYGYVVQEGDASLVKYIQFNDMIKEEGEEGEE
jgi:S-DNA-T family DNA segregation ATPase FtsK/SpoIIIE